LETPYPYKKPIIIMSGIKLDLHVHVKDRAYNWSPGISLADLASPYARKVAETTGLDGIGVVSYGSIPVSVDEARKIHKDYELFVLPGEEIKVVHEVDGKTYLPHLVAYGLETPVKQGNDIFTTLDELHDSDAVVILAHPFLNHNKKAVKAIVDYGKVHALEINHYQPTNRKTRSFVRKLLDDGVNISTTGGSDGKIGHEIGSYWTKIGYELNPQANYQNNIDNIVGAMKSGMRYGGTNQTNLGNLTPEFFYEALRNGLYCLKANCLELVTKKPVLPF